MIRSLEAVPNSYGPNQTMIFLQTYEDFDRKLHNFFNMLGVGGQEDFTPSYDNLPIFLDHIQNPPFIKMRIDEKLVTLFNTSRNNVNNTFDNLG